MTSLKRSLKKMPGLDEQEFAATFGAKMMRVEGAPPFDFWSYVESIPDADYNGYDCSDGEVTNVWRSDDGCYEHVLINTKDDSNVFMIIVLDLHESYVKGHRLLNLNREYGLDTQSPRETSET